jgi:acylphosphatase
VTSRRIVVRGRVQGVGYRASLRAEALRLGLTGWVRNREDGTVEALAVGPAPDVEALIGWARTGPRFARVTGVDVHEVPPAEAGAAGDGFRVTG